MISTFVAWAFSLGMMVAPDGFTAGIMVLPPSPAVNAWAQFLGTNLFAIGVINLFAAGNAWNRAVFGVLVGNIVLHALGMVFDWAAYQRNIVSFQGVLQGSVVHIVFIAGFCYYAFKKSTRGEATV